MRRKRRPDGRGAVGQAGAQVGYRGWQRGETGGTGGRAMRNARKSLRKLAETATQTNLLKGNCRRLTLPGPAPADRKSYDNSHIQVTKTPSGHDRRPGPEGMMKNRVRKQYPREEPDAGTTLA